MLIGLNGPYSGIKGFQVTILVHVLSILGDIRGIKFGSIEPLIDLKPLI